METKETINRDANIAQTIDSMIEEMLAPISKRKDNMTDQERYEEIRAGLSGRLLDIFDMLWEKAKSGERTKNVSPDAVLKAVKPIFRQWFMSKMEQKKEERMESGYRYMAMDKYMSRYPRLCHTNSWKIRRIFIYMSKKPQEIYELMQLPPKALIAYLEGKDPQKFMSKKSGDKFPKFPTYEEWKAEKIQEEKEKAEKRRLHQPVITAYEHMHGSFSSFPFVDSFGAHCILDYTDDPENALLDLPPRHLAAISREAGWVHLEDTKQGKHREEEEWNKPYRAVRDEYERIHGSLDKLPKKDKVMVICMLRHTSDPDSGLLDLTPKELLSLAEKPRNQRYYELVRIELSGRALEIFDEIWESEEDPSPRSVRDAALLLSKVEANKKERHDEFDGDIVDTYKRAREIRSKLSDQTVPSLDDFDKLWWNGEGEKPDDIVAAAMVVVRNNAFRARMDDVIPHD